MEENNKTSLSEGSDAKVSSASESKLSTPMAVIVAGIIIAVAIIISGGSSKTNDKSNGDPIVDNGENNLEALDNIASVTEADHIRGRVDSPVIIVEYSDFECPFCKRFHNEMKQVVEEYGDQVAWVYRQFPLDQLHPIKARLESMASECAADQGGDEAFWAFADMFYELTPSNNQTDTDVLLPQIANEIGLDVAEFNNCIAGEKFAAEIDADIQDAIATGGMGTPWSILIAPDGTKYPINGALPYSSLKQLIDSVLGE